MWSKFSIFALMIRTPKQFALFLAFVLAIISGIIDVLLELIMREDVSVLILLFTVLITGVLGYFVIYYFLEKLITQKIRTLYRKPSILLKFRKVIFR